MPIYNPITDSKSPDVVSNATGRASTFISGIITFFFILGTIYFIFYIIFSGLSIINSQGDEKKLAAAKTQLTNSVIGFVVILLVYAILGFIAALFKIELLNPTLPQLIK